MARRQLRDIQGGVWASFLQIIIGVGGNIDVNRSYDTNEVYKCKRLETQYFQPEDAYIHQSLQNPRAKSYVENSGFKNPVYMITGLKIARGVTTETSEGKGRGVYGKVGVDGTPVGIPVSGGPKAKWSSKTVENVSFTGSSDFVFSFQLIRIRSKKGGRYFCRARLQ